MLPLKCLLLLLLLCDRAWCDGCEPLRQSSASATASCPNRVTRFSLPLQVLPSEGERHKLKEACPPELASEGAGYK